MFKRIFIVAGVTVCLAILTGNAHAQLPQISPGLAYLESAQSSDGNWDNVASQVETTTATVAALQALKLLNQTGAAYSAGTSWLQAQSPQSVDFIAERILVLGLTDNSADALLPALDALRGGWGGYDGYAVNTLDTAYALRALQATGSGDFSTTNAALAFLTTHQNPDGGWGFLPGDDSNVYLTAVVSDTLQQFPQMTTIAGAISKAGTFLLGHQNMDGGFGSSPSTVYETALAYIALAAVSADPAVTSGAVSYLSATQAANGSWDDDPYSTALALRALYLSENKPSPPPPPPPGGSITGVLIDAATNQRLGGVAVVLASNPLVRMDTVADGSFVLNDVPAGAQQVNFSLEGYKAAAATATVVVDATTDLGDIALVSSYSTGTIAGIITDSAGQPLANVDISVNGAWSGNTVTGADGSFLFTYVNPGDVILSAAKDGYQTVTITASVYARTTLTFSPRLDTEPSQTLTGRLIGRVVGSIWDVPIDHLPEEKGVTVTLSGGIEVEPDPDNGGRFDIPELAPNTYQVTVGMNGFASQTFRVVIAPGVTTDLGTIRLEMSISKMTLAGKITDALSGAPIPGAEISVDGTLLASSSDFSGSYAIADIDHPSQITVKAAADGHIGKTFIINTAPWAQTLNFVLSPKLFTGSVKGTVVDTSLGTPLAGVTLTLVGDPSTSCVTDSAGNFVFPAVSSGPQQIGLAFAGYASRTLTTVVAAGKVNDVGSIGLGMYPLPASIQGTVWDGDAGEPFADVEVRTSGTGDQMVSSAADGSYRMDNVNPGTVTISASAVTKPGYQEARISGPLEAGGILVFSPALSTEPQATVDLRVQTDKEDYQKGETSIVTVYLKNQETVDHPLSLHLVIADPTGTSLFETTLDVSLPAEGTIAQAFNVALSEDIPQGWCRATAEAFGADGTLLGSGSKSFGVAVSRITVTPTLPAAFIPGANTVSFNLLNEGTLAVSAGVLDVVIKDPDGQVIFSTNQPFSLGLGESLDLPCPLVIPDLKFGTYTLTYAQNDETHQGRSVDIALPNSLTIDPLFDSASHRVGETAGLTVSLSNTGLFNLDPVGEGVPVTVSVPDAGYEETKSLVPVPAVDDAAPANLLYRFTVPVNMTAGLHGATITVTLPSGSSLVKTTHFAIPDSDLSLAPLADSEYLAGETITSEIVNNGGAGTQAQCRLSLYDTHGTLVADQTVTEAVAAGSSLALALPVPAGSVDGQYSLVVNYKDLGTGEEATIPTPITIQGVTGTLQVQTDKQTYLQSEIITGLSTAVNGAAPMTDGNLHLQVTAAAGNQQQKTWSSQNDFQQGVRSSVDTFETPDAVTLVATADNFEDGIFNTDRWTSSRSSSLTDYPPLEQNGSVKLTLPSNPPRNWISNNLTSRFRVAGDFDAMVDYNVISPWNRSGNNHAVGLQVFAGSWNTRIDVWGSSPTYGIIDSYGSYTNVGGARLNGRLRIRRVGKNYYVYYWNGSKWINPYSFGNRPSGPVGFTLLSFGQGGNVQVLYDNFTVVSHAYPNSGKLNLTYDSGRSEIWGNLDFHADIPSGTSIKFRTRSAETKAALANSVWSDYLSVSGSPIASPKGRWIEVEATLATTDTSVSPTLFDVTVSQGHQAGDILWQTEVPVGLSQNESFTPSNTIGALGTTGKYFLQGLLLSSTGQAVASAEYPFYVEQGDIQIMLATDNKVYKPGETVTLSGEVINNSNADAMGLILEVTDSAMASDPLHTETFDLAAGESHPFSCTTTAEVDGTYLVGGTVKQSDTLLSSIDEGFEVASPAVTANVTAPETVGNNSFPLCMTLTNSGKVSAAVGMRLTTDGGPAVDDQTIDIAPGENRVLQYPLQIVGTTNYTIKLTGDLEQTITRKVIYIPAPMDLAVSAKIVTDKMAYNPNEMVALSATVIAEALMENLSARISIINSQGQSLYTDSVAIPSLIKGQLLSLQKQWDTQTNPAGSYTVYLQVLNGEGMVVADTHYDITINAATSAAALLKGQLTLDKQSIFSGEPVSISYTVANSGNVDLSGVVLSVRTVDVTDQAVHDTISDQANLAMGATHENTVQIDTQEYGTNDYLVVLTANTDGVEETLAGVYLRVVKDETPPELTVHAPVEGETYFTGVPITAQATDLISGVEKVEYRLDDQSSWFSLAQVDGSADTYAAFWETLFEDDGPHTIVVRAVDKAGNPSVSAPITFEVLTDITPPETRIDIDEPSFQFPDGPIYVTETTIFSLTGTDSYSGVAGTEYRLDGGEWTPAEPFTIAGEGEHLVEYRSTDQAGNVEEPKTLTVTVDTTAPVTSIAFENQSFIDGDKLLLTAASKVILTATDALSGVAWTYYRFDDETDWRPYTETLLVTDLPYGAHVMHFYSEDHVDNAEAPQSVSFTLVDAEVEVELLNRPRVLVWTDDPEEKGGGHGPCSTSYTLEEIRNLVAQAMDSADAYVELVTEEEDFRENFRSGIFNVVMVLSQKERVDRDFLGELRDAVAQGRVGLLVSSWNNSVHPVLQDMFGVHFVGSMSMKEEQRELHLFDSEVSRQATLTAHGRILKTRLDGGILAGMFPGESRCQGLRSVSFTYPETLQAGDRITVSVYTEKGGCHGKDQDRKKLNLVDQEQMTVAALPSAGVNDYTGNPAGDLAITSADAGALSFSLAGPYGYLGSDYLLEVRIEHPDGSVVDSDLVPFTPTCDAHLFAGTNIGPFQVAAVDEDRVQISPDLPAVVLNQFGTGRTVFLAYDILESAMKGDSAANAGLLGESANYLVPESTGPEPAGIGLIQTTVSFEGAGMDLLAIDTLDPGLTHLSLFGLKEPPLEYRFSLEDGTQATYRYFVRFPDRKGDYAKKTELSLDLDGTAVPYDTYEHIFTVPTDSAEILQQAMQMAEDLRTEHSRDHRQVDRIISNLETIDALGKTTKSDYERVIRAVEEIIRQVEMLHLDTEDLQVVLSRYLRIMQTLQIDAEDDLHCGGHGHGHGWWRPRKREFYGPIPIDLDKRGESPCHWR